MKKIIYFLDFVIIILVTFLVITLVLYVRSDKQNQKTGENSGINKQSTFSHIFVIVLENKSYDDVIGNKNAPFINLLAKKYGLATNFFAVSHPSLPNYIALTSGGTQGILSDCNHCFLKADNIFHQLESHGKTWKTYLEQMPTNCFLNDYGNYVVHHNPAAYYLALRKSCQKNDVPIRYLNSDLANGTIANLTVIIPDNLDNMHSGSEEAADVWLKNIIPKIMESKAFSGRDVIFITWDEGGLFNHIPLLIISPIGKPQFKSSRTYSLYSLLATIEDLLDVPRLQNAKHEVSLKEFFISQ